MKRAFLLFALACMTPGPVSAASHEIRLLRDPVIPPAPPGMEEEMRTHFGGILLLLSSVDGVEWHETFFPRSR